MFNQAKFKDYVKQIDAKIYNTLPNALDMNKKYGRHYKLQVNRFLRRFDADINNPEQTLNEMCDFIQKDHLLSNYWQAGTDCIYGEHYGYQPSKEFILPFLVWNTFNEKAHLQIQELKKKPYLISNILKHITR